MKLLSTSSIRAAVLSLSLCSTRVDAEPATSEPAPLSETLSGSAREDYEAGKLLYANDDFRGAILKFQRAYDASLDPRLLWNMAAAEKRLRSYARVEALISRYLTEGGVLLSAADRAEAQEVLETVKAFVGAVTVRVDQPGAQVFVDDVLVGTTPDLPALRLDMGQRRVRVTKPGFRAEERSVEVVGAANVFVDVALAPEVHEGELLVVSDPGAVIYIGGRERGRGRWQGTLPSGQHEVLVSAPGKRTTRVFALVQDGKLSNVQVALEPLPKPAAPAPRDESGSSTWVWVGLGAALVAGLGVGAYVLFAPEDEERPAPAVEGTFGNVSLPLRW